MKRLFTNFVNSLLNNENELFIIIYQLAYKSIMKVWYFIYPFVGLSLYVIE